MKVYTLHEWDKSNEYEEKDTVLGVFSSIENAENALHKAEKIFNDSEFFIDEWELNDFSWEPVGKEDNTITKLVEEELEEEEEMEWFDNCYKSLLKINS